MQISTGRVIILLWRDGDEEIQALGTSVAVRHAGTFLHRAAGGGRAGKGLPVPKSHRDPVPRLWHEPGLVCVLSAGTADGFPLSSHVLERTRSAGLLLF